MFLTFKMCTFLNGVSRSLSRTATLKVNVTIKTMMFVMIRTMFVEGDARIVPFMCTNMTNTVAGALLMVNSVFILCGSTCTSTVNITKGTILNIVAKIVDFGKMVRTVITTVVMCLIKLILGAVGPVTTGWVRVSLGWV